MSATTVNLFLDKRASKGDEGVIKWLVSHEGKQRLFTTGLKISEQDWDFLKKHKSGMPGQVKNDYRRKLWNKLFGSTYEEEYTGKEVESFLGRARTIVGKLDDDFSFERFAYEISMFGQESKPSKETRDKNNVIQALTLKANDMNKEGRIGNALSYTSTSTSLLRFLESLTEKQRQELLNLPPVTIKEAKKKEIVLRFEYLTPTFLTSYEKWMLKHGRKRRGPKGSSSPATLTTVGIYCRHIRSVCNDAIDAGIMNRELYPFGKRRYMIPAGSNTKKALSKDDVLKIITHKCNPGFEQRSRDLWVFSYLCNGMNMNDICRIRWQDIEGDRLTFIRQKTARSTRGNQNTIKVSLFKETFDIIERWAVKSKNPKDYVFPFLEHDMTPERQKTVINQVVKITNQYMKDIAAANEITGDVNTYSARHSFATILLQSEAPLAFISQSLGHTSISTTESYLGSFDDEQTKKYLSALL
ncbi:tyrosine-type recombinase/integrase [Dyadobacter sp. CY347]|uniref:tyrosine-type recombinase/integrase n=1 Tax=Dyadobacter sp. CY347 TaxID=2909336 RepID=UPI001F2DF398|nr:tyrosine-type recombinase/integrase [Dyadobacter sp. CY347]MCF2490240.1 site-specific integrase [Dyadobacter sp. CY347]